MSSVKHAYSSYNSSGTILLFFLNFVFVCFSERTPGMYVNSPNSNIFLLLARSFIYVQYTNTHMTHTTYALYVCILFEKEFISQAN